MARTKRMLLITDADGKVIAAAHLGDPTKDGDTDRSQIGILPLSGQTIHHVAVPEEIVRLTQGHQLHAALSQIRLDPESGKLVFPKITARKGKAAH